MTVLKYKDPVTGTWLPISGAGPAGPPGPPGPAGTNVDEVVISITEPTAPDADLWYDPDAVTSADPNEIEDLRARVTELEAWRTDMEARIDQLGNN